MLLLKTIQKLNFKEDILTFMKQKTLEGEFKMSHYPDASKIENLANNLGLTFQKVTTWFQNRRARFKKAQS